MTRSRSASRPLNLVIAAIVYWNTSYMDKAAEHLRRHGRLPDPRECSDTSRRRAGATSCTGSRSRAPSTHGHGPAGRQLWAVRRLRDHRRGLGARRGGGARAAAVHHPVGTVGDARGGTGEKHRGRDAGGPPPRRTHQAPDPGAAASTTHHAPRIGGMRAPRPCTTTHAGGWTPECRQWTNDAASMPRKPPHPRGEKGAPRVLPGAPPHDQAGRAAAQPATAEPIVVRRWRREAVGGERKETPKSGGWGGTPHGWTGRGGRTAPA